MKRDFKVGQVIWRGYRYWADERDWLHGAQSGWNTCFTPYKIIKITTKWIVVEHAGNTIARRAKQTKDWSFFLNRSAMEGAGKQYHSKVHEYFYATKPDHDPEQKWRSKPSAPAVPTRAMEVLNLTTRPYSRDDVRRAYKRLARILHPDAGGEHEKFIELKKAHDEALRYAI